MPESSGTPSGGETMLMRLSVPADGAMRGVATEVAAKLAEYLGRNLPDAGAVGQTVEGLATRVCASDSGDITFEFRAVDRELVIQARCSGRSSEARYPLPA
jgi:hypothetical protein